MNRTQITMLSSMAGRDFIDALNRHVAWGLELLDLKDAIFDKKLIDLTIKEAEQAAAEIAGRGLQTYCLSSLLFGGFVEDGPKAFRRAHLDPLDHLLELAGTLRPVLVRLLVPETTHRSRLSNAVAYARSAHGWLFDLFAEAIERIQRAGYHTTIENEVGGCLLSSPREVRDFFSFLGPLVASFTWDVQNMWQMGTFPSLAVYKELKPLIGYLHLKGGRSVGNGRDLVWASPLEEASWPVAKIVRSVLRDGISPVICLNMSHGKIARGYDRKRVVGQDLCYVRRLVREIEDELSA